MRSAKTLVFTGKPCKKGHVCGRYPKTLRCFDCENRPKRKANKLRTNRIYWKSVDRAHRMILKLRSRAKVRGIEFSIKESDLVLPTHCPIFGIELDYSGDNNADNLASVDRIDSTRGYVRGNVRVISFLANVIKQKATVEQLGAIIEYMKGQGP